MTGQSGVLAAIVVIAVAGVVPAASQTPRSETSGWQQRLAPASKREPKPGTKVRSSKVDPSQAPKASLGRVVGPAPRASLGPTTVPTQADAAAPGSDAAYEAFDQGKYLTALAIAAKQAEAGDAVAHTLVARIHAEGLGVAQDAKLAAQWYARGAELGDPEAALGLGTLFARGDGVAQNYAKAAELFEKAAMTGHAEAAYNLALLFLAGKGKPELPHRGFMLMSYAAEKGITPAMYDLGTLYATGTGTSANVFEAAKWIGKAASAGCVCRTADHHTMAALVFVLGRIAQGGERRPHIFNATSRRERPNGRQRVQHPVGDADVDANDFAAVSSCGIKHVRGLLAEERDGERGRPRHTFVDEGCAIAVDAAGHVDSHDGNIGHRDVLK